MLELYKNIKARRNELGLTQTDLALALGYSDKSMISRIEKGRVDLPQSKIVEFAKALHTTPSILMGWEDDEYHDKNIRGVRIPVLGEVVAGIPIDAVEDYIDWEEISPDLADTGDFFALKIKGDSMAPRILAGDVVIVKVQPCADTGDIVIAMVNGSEACCKKFTQQDDGIILQSFNPIYEPMFFNKKEIESLPVVIVGKVIENRQKF